MIKNSLRLAGLMLLLTCSLSAMAQSSLNPWSKPYAFKADVKAKADVWASEYQALELNVHSMKSLLEAAPLAELSALSTSEFIFYLPMPDGSFSAFRVIESPVMEKGLAVAFPQIKTYAGKGIDDPTATLRFDVTQFGFHAMMISTSGTVFIDPVSLTDPNNYVCYYKKHALPQDEAQYCLNEEQDHDHGNPAPESVLEISGQLRTYRLALACTGEYAAYYGGTKAGALAGMVTSVNRINSVYEREFGIHLNLIENDTLVIFLNASTDPYTNNNGSTMLSQNQNTMNSVIGSANYDMGHVFSTGGGGIAQLGCICNVSNKAKGVTGMNTPIGDAFDIDYVAHEMGHQFGGNHTFNSTAGSCGGGNRVAQAAYEPGSGSTIMAYAGICTGQDLQQHSDDYFHTKSFDEIVYYSHFGNGNSCPVTTTFVNAPPILTIPGDFTIPLNTPFRLTAQAYDPDGDPITYCWEQFDLGPAGTWNAPSGNAPIFRSFDPVTTGTRLFPKLSNILNNNTTIGEIKPSYARTLNFRCTVRDYILPGCGVTYNPTTVKVIVAPTPGPFEVTSQNTTGITWVTTTTETVTWSVNGSDQAPVNTPFVNVLLSVDGGYTWVDTLGLNVPNNGSYSFVVPAYSTNQARVMVEGAGNIFFDINNKNFSITQNVGIDESLAGKSVVLYPNPTQGIFMVRLLNDYDGNGNYQLSDLSGKILLSGSIAGTRKGSEFSIDLQSFENGIYFLRIEGHDGVCVKRIIKN